MRALTGLLGAGLLTLACAVGPAEAQPAQVGYMTQRDASGAALNFCDLQSSGLPGTIHTPCHSLGFLNGVGAAVVAGSSNPFPIVDAQLHADMQALTAAMSAGSTGSATAANQTAAATQAHTDAQAIAAAASAPALASGAATAAGQTTAHADAGTQATATAATTSAVSAAAAQAHADAGTIATLAGQATAHADAQAIATADQATAAKLAAGGVGVVQPDALNSGSIAAATLNSSYTVQLANGEGVVGFAVAGLTAAGATLTAEAQNNSSAWYAINTVLPGTGALSSTITADGNYRVNAAGHTAVRLRVSTAAAAAASIAVGSSASSSTGLVALSAPLPSGSNPIGSVSGVTPNFVAAGQTMVSNTLSASGASSSFTPIAGRDFHLTIPAGTGSATCHVESKPDGANWVYATIGGSELRPITYTGAPISETLNEAQAGVPYRLDCGASYGSVSSGSLNPEFTQ